jgi:predicted Zn-dependent peptidase
MLEEFDGPFARSQSFASLHEAGLDYNYYDLLIDTIRYITPEEIMQLAQRYFDPKSMLTVVAGAR